AHYGKTPPCTEALIQAGITRVVVACEDPNPLVGKNSQERLMQAGIAYASGLCQAEAHALNQGFFMRMQAQRPFVRLKTAMSLDGRTAMKCGQSQWITGIPSRQLVQKLRAQSDVILTGIETVLIDDPSLTVRDEEILSLTHFKPPHRVILDTALRMPLGAKLLSLPAEVWIYTCSADEEKKAALSERGAKIFMMPEKDRCVDLVAVMHHLAEQQVNEVLVEAGSRLNGSFLQAGLVDEWHLFIAPKIMGDTARGLCTLPITELTEAYALTIKQHFQVGEDWCVIAHPAQHSA
ncbi:MAG TPA: bifunctional diaminohydroxyphosphoribosylaminopyrimidine deaminase/5-amino-6-(5-phosphoribosylamino)uracil reductase RibD, partial [Gammaproteobacteria bacterium]|nr:bifunctional diaminohydroxyphosphoribosylaminopyrimidine deaminase/5-amino-6-(5-phosphoribosylamino)uracil reductase RibD [Gammaproteobacteria bacterium]